MATAPIADGDDGLLAACSFCRQELRASEHTLATLQPM